jgi:hypothetical protein
LRFTTPRGVGWNQPTTHHGRYAPMIRRFG